MLKIHMQATAIVALPTLSLCPTTILCLISLNDQAKASVMSSNNCRLLLALLVS
jgi:hypothetical protein